MSGSRSQQKKESPSKELRVVLFQLFNKEDEGYQSFTDYYENKMKHLIDFFKKKLHSK